MSLGKYLFLAGCMVAGIGLAILLAALLDRLVP